MVQDYQHQFLTLLIHASSLSEEQQIQLFTVGLHGTLRIDVELQAPTNLEVVMSLARAYKLYAKLAAQPVLGGPRPWRGHSVAPAIGATQQAAPTPPAPTALTTINSRPARLPHRVLSPDEMQVRQQAELCYNCDEKFSPQHRCKRLFYLCVPSADTEDDAAQDRDHRSGDIIVHIGWRMSPYKRHDAIDGKGG